MRIIALIAAYNEELYLRQLLEHLFRHGVDTYLIDNDSTDRTASIAKEYVGRGVIGIETMSRAHGHSLFEKLERKEELASSLDAEWFIHMDADEFRLPPRADQTLAEALTEADSQGYNAVNFLEYVFIPTKESPEHEHENFQETMRSYYPFVPKLPYRLTAWKRQPERVNLSRSGGHWVEFPGLRMSPKQFRIRHYHFLSMRHAAAKHVGRPYTEKELARGWHRWRRKIRPEMIVLPSQDELSAYASDDELDPSRARRIQYLGGLVSDNKGVTSLSEGTTNPVPFIIGSPRSGTNLLSIMLDSHPDQAMIPETHFIPDVVQECLTAKSLKERFIDCLTHHMRWPDFEIDIDEFRRRIQALPPSLNMTDAFREFYGLYAETCGKSRWGEHSHVYCKNPELIKGLFPEARFIHIVRDARDVVLSLKRCWFASTDLKELAETWKERIIAARQARSWAHYLEIRYEDLVLSPEVTLKRVCDFLDLQYHADMLDYHRRADERLKVLSRDFRTEGGTVLATAEQRMNNYLRLNKPPDPSRIGYWKQEMSGTDLAAVESIAADLLYELGY